MADKDIGMALLALGSLMGGYNQGRTRNQGLDIQRERNSQAEQYRTAQMEQSQAVESRRAQQGDRRLDLMERESRRPRGTGSPPSEVYAGNSILGGYDDAGSALQELQTQLEGLANGPNSISRQPEIESLIQQINQVRMAEGYSQIHGAQQQAAQPEPAGKPASRKGGGGTSIRRSQPGQSMMQGLQQALQGGQPISMQGGRPMGMQGAAVQSGQQPTGTGAVPLPDPRAIAAEGSAGEGDLAGFR